eukprot:g874.t1
MSDLDRRYHYDPIYDALLRSNDPQAKAEKERLASRLEISSGVVSSSSPSSRGGETSVPEKPVFHAASDNNITLRDVYVGNLSYHAATDSDSLNYFITRLAEELGLQDTSLREKYSSFPGLILRCQLTPKMDKKKSFGFLRIRTQDEASNLMLLNGA